MTYRVELRGIDGVEAYLAAQPKRTEKAMRFAVSSATRFAYTLGRRKMQEQIAFKSSYLTSSEGGSPRYAIVRRPTPGNPVGVIRGRVRGTSLNRFVTSTATKKTDLRAKIKAKGRTHVLKRAFRINLKNGNRGIALRLPKGQTPTYGKGLPYGKSGDRKNSSLFLLYGPSVQQVFSSVAPDIAPEVADYMNREFVRQFERSR